MSRVPRCHKHTHYWLAACDDCREAHAWLARSHAGNTQVAVHSSLNLSPSSR